MIFIDHTDVLEGQVAVIDITGPLDSTSSTEFEEYANRILEGETRYLIFNMEKVDYISSAGIGLILYLQKTVIRLGGYLVLFQLNEEIRSLFALLGFEHIISITETRIEAMEIIDRQMEIRESGIPAEDTAGSPEPEEESVTGDEVPEENLESIEEEFTIEYALDETRPAIPPAGQVKKWHFDPFIIECGKCTALIRISEPGQYMCPDCHTAFSVDNEMSVEYR